MIKHEALDYVEITLEDVNVLLEYDREECTNLEIEHGQVYYIDEYGTIGTYSDDFNTREALEEGILDDDMPDYVAEDIVELSGGLLTAEMIELYDAYEDCDSDLLVRVFERFINN